MSIALFAAGPNAKDFVSDVESSGIPVEQYNTSVNLLDVAPHDMAFSLHILNVRQKVSVT